MALSDEQIDIILLKGKALPNAHRRDLSVNYYEGWFFVTLNTRGYAPVLSECVGNPHAKDGEADAPRCEYSALGKGVMEAWKRSEEIYDNVIVDMAEAMPDHFHGLIYLKPGNKKHLGRIIWGFMAGCSHAYWDILGIPWREMTYVKGARAPEWQDSGHTLSKRGPALFVHGYNDMEAITEKEVEIKRAYIKDQARKRLIQGDKHLCFIKRRNQHSRNWTMERAMQAISNDRFFRSNREARELAQMKVRTRLNIDARGICLDYVGNRGLLEAKWKLPLICHRADAELFEQQKEAVLNAARDGAVIVSAFISPKEREIREQLMVELLPFVEIMDNGFSEKHKPSGRAFYAMAEDRLTQVSCWDFLFQKDVEVCREMCLVMNEVARAITGVEDDWWKQQASLS